MMKFIAVTKQVSAKWRKLEPLLPQGGATPVLAFLFFVTFIAYLDRVSIAHAIVPIGVEYALSPLQKGYILGAFSVGYVVFMIPLGAVVDRVGSKAVAGYSVVAWSVLMVWAALSSTRFELIAARLALGAAEAPIFPANAKLVSQLIPEHGRARATAIFDSGSYVGMACAGPVVVMISEFYGWRLAFGVLAFLGVVWVALWTRYASSFVPIRHAHAAEQSIRPNLLVLCKLMTNRKIAAASTGFFCYNYVKAFFLTWLPSFLVAEKGFSTVAAGWLTIAPPLVAVAVELGVARWSDGRHLRTGSKQVARKAPICFGFMAASVLIFAPDIDDAFGLTVLLCVAFSGVIAASPAIWSIPADLAPSLGYVGTIGGIQNAFANVAGIVAPVLTGWILQRSGSFEPALLLTVAVALVGICMYTFGIGKIAPICVSEK